MGKQTYVACMVDGDGNVCDFYRYDCKKHSTVENSIRKAMSDENMGLMSIFRKDWILKDVVACEVFRSPDGIHKEQKPVRRFSMDWAEDMRLKSYYRKTNPDDPEGYRINEDSTFGGLLDVINRQGDVYGYIGVSDSLIRETLFNRLAKIMGVDYGEVYSRWLGN